MARRGFKRYTMRDAAKDSVDRWIDNVRRGASECQQDDVENCHFAGIGGLENRMTPTAPDYIEWRDREAFIRGYTGMAKEMYGADWQTCAFSWSPALTIGGGR